MRNFCSMPMCASSRPTRANSWPNSMTSYGHVFSGERGVATIQRMPRAAAGLNVRKGFLGSGLVAVRLRPEVPEFGVIWRRFVIGIFLHVGRPLFMGVGLLQMYRRWVCAGIADDGGAWQILACSVSSIGRFRKLVPAFTAIKKT